MGREGIDDLLGDVRRLLERAQNDTSRPEGEAALERAWAIGHLERLKHRLESGFVPPRIVRGPEAWPAHLTQPGRMAIDPRNSGPEDYAAFDPCDPYYQESNRLGYRYMRLDDSCDGCLDALWRSLPQCPHCGHSLVEFLGRFHAH